MIPLQAVEFDSLIYCIKNHLSRLVLLIHSFIHPFNTQGWSSYCVLGLHGELELWRSMTEHQLQLAVNRGAILH